MREFIMGTTQAVQSVSAVLTLDSSNCGNNSKISFTVLLKESITTVSAPITNNIQDGSRLYILFTNTASNWAVSGWNSIYKFSGSSAPTIQVGAHDSMVVFQYFSLAKKWIEVSREITLP